MLIGKEERMIGKKLPGAILPRRPPAQKKKGASVKGVSARKNQQNLLGKRKFSLWVTGNPAARSEKNF